MEVCKFHLDIPLFAPFKISNKVRISVNILNRKKKKKMALRAIKSPPQVENILHSRCNNRVPLFE